MRAAVLLVVCALVAGPARAAIAFDQFGTHSGAATTANPITWTHTPIGTPRAVTVTCVVEGDLTDTIGAVTYGGVAMSEVSGSPVLRDGTEDGAVHGFVLLASIPTGAQTVNVANSGTTNRKCLSRTFTAGNTVEVVATGSISTQADGDVTNTLALGGATAVVVESAFTGIGSIANCTPLTDWTDISETDFGVALAVFYNYDIVGSSNVTFGVSHFGNVDLALLAIALREVPVAGAARKSLPMRGV